MSVFENRVLRNLIGPKRNEATAEWRRLHNEIFYMNSSPNIIRVIKSRRMRGAGHVARMEERRGVYRFFAGETQGKGTLGRPRRRWIILKWNFKKQDM